MDHTELAVRCAVWHWLQTVGSANRSDAARVLQGVAGFADFSAGWRATRKVLDRDVVVGARAIHLGCSAAKSDLRFPFLLWARTIPAAPKPQTGRRASAAVAACSLADVGKP